MFEKPPSTRVAQPRTAAQRVPKAPPPQSTPFTRSNPRGLARMSRGRASAPSRILGAVGPQAAARRPRTRQDENARERTVHDARRAPSPRTAARHSAFGLFLLHLVEKALQDEADDHDDYDRDYDRNRPTWHHNASPFRLFARRPSPKPAGALHPCDITSYYRAFTRRATAPRAHR